MMKRIMKVAFMAFVLTATGSPIFAQTDNNLPQRGKQRKPLTEEQRTERRKQQVERHAQMIAGQLALDDATTARFVEVFKQQAAETEKLRANCPLTKKEARKDKELTEAEAKQILEGQFDRQEKMQDLRKKYYKEYCKFLTQKQILRIYEMDKQHKRHQFKGRKGNGCKFDGCKGDGCDFDDCKGDGRRGEGRRFRK